MSFKDALNLSDLKLFIYIFYCVLISKPRLLTYLLCCFKPAPLCITRRFTLHSPQGAIQGFYGTPWGGLLVLFISPTFPPPLPPKKQQQLIRNKRVWHHCHGVPPSPLLNTQEHKEEVMKEVWGERYLYSPHATGYEDEHTSVGLKYIS